jgi:uncharacterized protein (TIRG00374 family)
MRKAAVRIILTGLLLGWLFTQVDFRSVGAIVAGVRLGWLGVAALINIGALLCATWRWQILLYAMGVRQRFMELIRIVLVGTFFSMFLPSSIGGDLMKMVLIAPDIKRREAAISSVLMDRVVGMAVTIAVGLLAVLFLPSVWGDRAVVSTLGISTLLFCVGAVALFSTTLVRLIGRLTPGPLWRRIGDPLMRVHASLVSLRGQPGALLAASGVSALRQLAICGSVFCAGQAFGIAVGPVPYFAMVPISMAITALPIAINGLGLQDNALILLLGLVGIGSAQALTLSLFIHTMRNLTGLIGGIVFAVGRRRRGAAPAPAEQPTEGTSSEREQLQPVRQ